MDAVVKLCKANGIVDDEKGGIEFVLTSKVSDRDNDIVEPSGAILDNFKSNPVLIELR